MSNRLERLQKTDGMSIHEIGFRRLVERKDWIELLGAEFPKTGHWWGRKKDGRPKFIGPVPKNPEKEMADGFPSNQGL